MCLVFLPNTREAMWLEERTIIFENREGLDHVGTSRLFDFYLKLYGKQSEHFEWSNDTI